MTDQPATHRYVIHRNGESASFPHPHPILEGGSEHGEITVLLGVLEQELDPNATSAAGKLVVLVELGSECLAVHTGGCDTPETSNVVGFARWRLGANPPSNLVELVGETGTKWDSIAAARALFESAGFDVSVCADRAGRIVDRLMRPQFNLALRAVDDGLATPEDLELCLQLGLGYRRGLLAPLCASGLEDHHRISAELFNAYGLQQYAPARRSVVAALRAHRKTKGHP